MDTSGTNSVQSPYPYGLMLPQSETERLLEERLQGLGVSVERRTEVLDFTRTESGVQPVLQYVDRRQETVSANWTLGCDGDHSVVRHTMATPFAGETLDGDWMLGDVQGRLSMKATAGIGAHIPDPDYEE